jgi:hypothetical protein
LAENKMRWRQSELFRQNQKYQPVPWLDIRWINSSCIIFRLSLFDYKDFLIH